MSASFFTSQRPPTTRHIVTHLEYFLENIDLLRAGGIRQSVAPVVVRFSAVCILVRALEY